jgi:hypothetical protein
MMHPRPSSVRSIRPLLALGLLLLVTACGIQLAPDAPSDAGPLPRATLEQLDPQPPALPGPDAPNELHEPSALRPGDSLPSLSTQALSADRVALAMLVIGATAEDPALAAWEALLDQAGVPHDVLIATERQLTSDLLVESDGTGKYQAILLATNNLSYDAGGGSFESAFSSTEWNLLWQYERTFDVRQVALYTFPGLLPESYGIVEAVPGGAAPDGYTVEATSEGQAVFDYLASGAQIPVRNAWLYRSELSDDSNAVPLLVDGAGNVLAVTSTSSDGRERLAVTFDQAAYGGVPLLHTQLLGHGLIRWASKGVFLGERRYHFDADVDDWFIPTALWDTETGDFSTEAFELSANDAFSFAQQQQALRSAHPFASDFTWVMAYNGEGSDPAAPSSCDPENAAANALSSMTKCVADDFRWINHTWSHAYMDRNPPFYDIGYARILEEIELNDDIVDDFGFGAAFEERSLVTGDISGLGWFAAEGPDTGPKIDYGLEASNPDLLRALLDTGRTYIASNMSTPSHEPDCSGCGIWHPLEPDVLTVPRWPTNVFAAVHTPEAAVQAYNLIYGPGGSEPFYPEDLSYPEYLDVETDIALAHVLSGAAYPHYFHVANLYEYAPGSSLLSDYADRLFEKYAGYVDLPLRSLPWDELGAYVADRTSHVASGVAGVWDREADTLEITASSGGTVFLTGAVMPGGSDETYGSDTISRRTFAPGETVSVDAPAVDPPSEEPYVLTVSVVGEGAVTGAGTYRFFETATLEATPADGWAFVGWSGDLAGSANPATLAMTGDRSVTATFGQGVAQTISFAPLAERSTANPPFGIVATASSGLPVALAADGVCSISGSTVTLDGIAGTCTITASQEGDDVYRPAVDVARTFDVVEASEPLHSLAVTTSGSGIGLVISSPDGVHCSGACAASFEEGTLVTLAPVAVYGSSFSGWTGACGGSGGCSVELDGDRTVGATFELAAP